MILVIMNESISLDRVLIVDIKNEAEDCILHHIIDSFLKHIHL